MVQGDRAIKVTGDFSLWHSLVYFVYSRKISVVTDRTTAGQEYVWPGWTSRMPNPCSAIELYNMAQELEMEDLRMQILQFLDDLYPGCWNTYWKSGLGL